MASWSGRDSIVRDGLRRPRESGWVSAVDVPRAVRERRAGSVFVSCTAWTLRTARHGSFDSPSAPGVPGRPPAPRARAGRRVIPPRRPRRCSPSSRASAPQWPAACFPPTAVSLRSPRPRRRACVATPASARSEPLDSPRRYTAVTSHPWTGSRSRGDPRAGRDGRAAGSLPDRVEMRILSRLTGAPWHCAPCVRLLPGPG
jgi:hypothetical protein